MGKGKGHIPVRTCISCRAKRSKEELVRLTLDPEGQLVMDTSGTMPGRGAYVCKAVSCHEQLSGNRHLNRLFRTDKVIIVSSALRIDGVND